MPQPPVLSQEQRRTAFERSLELRKERAEVKRLLGLSGRLWVYWYVPEAQGMKVYDLLTALPGVGRAKALKLLTAAGIPEKNTVRACGPRQRERLLALL